MSSETEQNPTSRKVGWLELSVLLCSGIPPAVGMGLLLPVLPKIEEALARNPGDTYLVKFISTAVGLGVVIGAPVGGYLADRYGRKPILIGSLFLFALFGMCGYWLNDLYELIGVRFMVGVAGAATIAAGATLIGDLFEGNTCSRIMGWNVALGTFVGGIAIPMAGYLGAFSWRLPFLVHAITIPVALLAFGLKTVPQAQPAAALIDVQSPPVEREPFPYSFIFFALLCGVVVLSVMTFVPFRLRELHVQDPNLISVALVASIVTNVISSVLFGMMRKHLSVEQSFMATYGVCAVGAFSIAFAPTYWTLLAGALVWGLGMGAMAPNVLAVAAGLVSQARRGRVMGAVKGTFLSGSFVAVFLFEPFSKMWGAWASLCAIGGLSTLMFLLVLIRYMMVAKPQLQGATP